MKKLVTMFLLVFAMTTTGCTSVGTFGMLTKSSGDPGALLRNGQTYKELGPVHASACRFFLLAVVPWDNGTLSYAVDKALDAVGGDALLNVTMSNSLYGFIPIYNVFSYTCTDVSGIAIKFDKK